MAQLKGLKRWAEEEEVNLRTAMSTCAKGSSLPSTFQTVLASPYDCTSQFLPTHLIISYGAGWTLIQMVLLNVLKALLAYILEPDGVCSYEVYSFPRAALTNYLRFGDLKWQTFIFSCGGHVKATSSISRFWQRYGPSEGSRRILPCLFYLLVAPAVPCRSSHPSLLLSSSAFPLCLCHLLFCLFKDSCHWI